MKKLFFLTLLVLTFFVNNVTGQVVPAVSFNNANFKGGIWVRDSIKTPYFVLPKTAGLSGQVLKLNSDNYHSYWGSIDVPNYWTLTGDKLTPTISTNYINTDSAYYIKSNLVLHYSKPLNIFGCGKDVLSYNIGQYIGASGFGVLKYNTGNGIGASGYNVLNENTGSNIGASGYNVLNFNTGSNIVANGILLANNNTLSDWYFYGTGSDTTTIPINGYMGFGTFRNHLIGKTCINNSYWLPTTDGTTGYGLGTNGVGVLGWYRYLGFADTATLLTQSNAIKLYGDDYAHMQVSSTQSNPVDNATYYVGSSPMVLTTSSNTYQKTYFSKACTITNAEFYFTATNAAGTNENITAYIRINNTTDYEIAKVGAATAQRRFSNNSLNVVVSAGDYFEIKIVCPNWATNPSSVVTSGILTIKY